MNHVYDIKFRLDLGNSVEGISEILSNINETFQKISGMSDKLTLTVPFSMTMKTSRQLSAEKIEKLTKLVKDTAKATKLRFESIKYIGVE